VKPDLIISAATGLAIGYLCAAAAAQDAAGNVFTADPRTIIFSPDNVLAVQTARPSPPPKIEQVGDNDNVSNRAAQPDPRQGSGRSLRR
jgi:hypothetical protein